MTLRRAKDMDEKARLADGYLRAVAGADTLEPRPGFREAALTRIEKRVQEGGGAGRREARGALIYPGRLRRAVLVPAAAIVVMVLFTGGAYAFSLDAAPDSSLYGTKIFFEKGRMALTGSAQAKVDYGIELIEKRVAELQDMVERGAARGGSRWETAYRNNLNGLYAQILSLPEERQEQMLAHVASLLEEQVDVMSQLDWRAHQDLAPYIENAKSCGTDAMRRMRECCREGQQEGEQGEPGGGGHGHEQGQDGQRGPNGSGGSQEGGPCVK